MKSHYETLGVARGVNAKQLRARFLELARERHPDRFQGEERVEAESVFQNITEAFNVLSNPKRRREHDQDLDRPTRHGQDRQQLTKVYINRGVRAFKGGNLIEAADNFHRATEVAPRNAQAWHHLARVCIEEERWWPKAQEAIERACELAPERAAYAKLAGKIFERGKMAARAKQYYNRALELGESDPTIRRALRALEGRPSQPADTKSKGTSRKKLW